MPEADDHRKYVRLKTEQITQLKESSEQAPDPADEGNIENVSKGGVLISSWTTFPVGTVIEFELALPNAPEKIPAVGVVRRALPDEEPPAMGVEFLRISKEHLAALNEYVDAYESET